MLQEHSVSHAKPGERSAGWRAAALLLACSLYALLVLWTGSYPGTPFVWLIASATGGVVLIVIWAVLLFPGPLKLWAEIVGVSVAAAAIVGSIAGLSLLARFAASAADFNAVAQALPAPAGVADSDEDPRFPGNCPDKIGWYRISECRNSWGGYLFLQNRNAISDDAAIAYLPEGPPKNEQGTTFRHLGGAWYSWRLEPMGP